jgi:hypothetical protein
MSGDGDAQFRTLQHHEDLVTLQPTPCRSVGPASAALGRESPGVPRRVEGVA